MHIDPRFLLGLKRVPLHFTMAGLNREVQTTYPELGSNFKAAHVNIVACFMAHLVNEVMVLRDAHGKSIATMFWGMADFVAHTGYKPPVVDCRTHRSCATCRRGLLVGSPIAGD